MKTPTTFPAALNDRLLKKAEKQHQAWQPIRRAALAILRRDSIDLTAALQDEKSAEALLDFAQSLDDFMAWREDETKFLTAAHARLWLVLGQESERLLAAQSTENGEAQS